MRDELTKEELLLKAQTYCARSEHCASEVREKLWQWGCKEERWRSEIIESLEDEGYINAERYCRAYVHDKVEYQGWGRVKIRMMLRGKSLPELEIELALAEIDENSYRKQLMKALSHYKDDRERAIRYAMQKGFEYEIVAEELVK